MTLQEMKEKILTLIEEADSQSPYLTNDPDIDAKLNHVINQVQYELARVKKIPDYTELEVKEGNLVKFNDINTEYEIYQLDIVKGINSNGK